MKKLVAKKIVAENIKPAVQKQPSKPRKKKLSKSDPAYFSKIGSISAKKRAITSEQFSEMARKSHPRKPGVSKGGRPKKVQE
jgi:hypothetical protein